MPIQNRKPRSRRSARRENRSSKKKSLSTTRKTRHDVKDSKNSLQNFYMFLELNIRGSEVIENKAQLDKLEEHLFNQDPAPPSEYTTPTSSEWSKDLPETKTNKIP